MSSILWLESSQIQSPFNKNTQFSEFCVHFPLSFIMILLTCIDSYTDIKYYCFRSTFIEMRRNPRYTE